jgi:flagellar motor switch protein FliG
LSQSREVPPDIVKELEDHIKAKIPYLVGGADWIQSVYQYAQPQNQRALLGSLNQQSPELAQALRRKSFFMEDLANISAGALRTLIQEAGYPTAALALRDEKPEVRTALLNRLPVALREILQQELDLSNDDKAAMMDAKVRLMNIGRRLLTEGRIALPETKAR